MPVFMMRTVNRASTLPIASGPTDGGGRGFRTESFSPDRGGWPCGSNGKSKVWDYWNSHAKEHCRCEQSLSYPREQRFQRRVQHSVVLILLLHRSCSARIRLYTLLHLDNRIAGFLDRLPPARANSRQQRATVCRALFCRKNFDLISVSVRLNLAP